MTKISQLGEAAGLSGTEVLPIVQSGETKKASVNQLFTFVETEATRAENSATAAAADADQAEVFKNEAEDFAIAAAAFSGPFYISTAEYYNGTPVNDEEFMVRPNVNDTTADVYLNDNGTPVFSRKAILAPGASGASAEIGHIATGTGAVARTLKNKLDEELSVFDFMSPLLQVKISLRTSTSADAAETTSAILVAIAAANQRTVRFPAGVYDVNEVHVTLANVYLKGDGPSATLIRQRTANADTFKFGPPTSGSFLSNPRIEGMNITHASVVDASTTGAAVRFVQCNAYRLRDMSLNDSPEGLVVEGGQLGSLKTFNVFASTGTAKGAGSALLHFKEADLGSGTFQPCYTVQIEDFRLSSNKLRDTCIRIASADGMNFCNGYVAFGNNSLCRVNFDRDGAYVAGCAFTNTYFDCVNVSTGTPNAIIIADDAFTNSTVFDFKIGAGCIIGNGSQRGLLCTKPEVMLLSAQDARFVNFDVAAFEVENASGDLLDVLIDGCHFQNCGSVSSSVVRLNNGRSLTLSNNIFADNVNVQVQLAGTWRTGSITGNVNTQTTVADLSRGGATFTSALVISGNSSRRALAADSWIGNRVGNVSNSDGNVLDWYEEGTFTPTIEFGGASVGITYSHQAGTYTRIGNRVFYNVSLTLTSKGSSTGELRVQGLPFVSSDAAVNYPVAIRINNTVSDYGVTHCSADVIGGDSAIRLAKMNTSGGVEIAAPVTNADIDNSFRITTSGHYRCA